MSKRFATSALLFLLASVPTVASADIMGGYPGTGGGGSSSTGGAGGGSGGGGGSSSDDSGCRVAADRPLDAGSVGAGALSAAALVGAVWAGVRRRRRDAMG